jgi:signal transduction histidine kinase
MFGLIILAVIIFAVIQHRKYRRRLRWQNRTWGAWHDRTGRAERIAYEFQKDLRDKIKQSAQSWSEPWRSRAEQAEKYAADFERSMADKFDRQAERFERKLKRKFDRQTRKYGGVDAPDPAADQPKPQFKSDTDRQAYERARKRAQAEAGFYLHLMWYGVIIGFLFLINLLTSGLGGYPWFLWPALGWGFGLASHFTAVFGWRWIHERVFEPAIQREVQREVLQEKEVLRTEKQASLDELTATFAHEIRNPIAAAKSLVQQMGEDPTSHENVEYAKVALDELARVERSVSHLLKYAKEEDYHFENVNLAAVLDGALTQMRSKLEANSVAVSRNYLGGPTVRADADKLRQVFSNIIDNAIDAMATTEGERRIDVAIQRASAATATVRIRDNGCGISGDKLGKIFNPFYTSKDNGTGLGLGVAKKVIDSHRGTIAVESRVGVGTEFAMSIPLADAVREGTGAEAAARDGASGAVQSEVDTGDASLPAVSAPAAMQAVEAGSRERQ